MKHIATTLSAALAAVALLAGSAYAQPGLAEARKALLLQKFDANGNGEIDLPERKALQDRRADNRAARHERMLELRETR